MDQEQEYIQSQYGNSPTIKTILENFGDVINPDADINVFYQNIMDIDSANGIGLDVLGKIVGANRILTLDENTEVKLNDNMYKIYIKFKMLANISETSLAFLNKISYILYNNTSLSATNVVTRGTLDNGDYYNTNPMQVRFTWRTNSVSNEDRAIFMQGVLFCLAAGVGWDLQIISENNDVFGFYGSGLNPFNQGTFVHIDTREVENTDGDS